MPVVTLDYKNSIIYDTCTSSGQPDTPLGNNEALSIGYNAAMSFRTFIQFDVGSIPNGAIINSAKLLLSRHSSNVTTNFIEVKNIVSNWNNNITHNTQPTLGNLQTTNRVDFSSSSIELDLLPMVKSWVNSETRNFGICLFVGESGGGYFTAYSTESATALKPRVVIDYTLPTNRKDVYLVSKGDYNSAGTQMDVQIPSGYKAGDIAIIAMHNNTPTTDVKIPSGWTVLNNTIANDLRYIFVYKILSDSEPTVRFESVTYTNSGWYATSVVYRNVKSVGGYSHNVFPTATRDLYPPDIMSTSYGDLYLSINLLNTSNTAMDRPKGFTGRQFKAFTNHTHDWSDKDMHSETNLSTREERMTSYLNSAWSISFAVILTPFTSEPTPPKNVRVDKTEYEVGDTIKVSFDPGTDPEGGKLKYKMEQYDPTEREWKHFGDSIWVPAFMFCMAMADTNSSKVRISTINDKGSVSATVESQTFTAKQKQGQITAPVEVTSASFYSLNKVPVMRFSNGWLGYVVRNASSTIASVLLSKDNGKTWAYSGDINGSIVKGISATSNGNMLYVVYASSATRISALGVDVRTLTTNGSISANVTTVLDVTDNKSVDVTFDKVNNKLLVVSASKTAAYPTSFNVHRTDIKLDASGVITGSSYIKAVTTVGNSVINYNNVSIDATSDGAYEYIACAEVSGSNNFFNLLSCDRTTNVWNTRLRRSTDTGAIINPNVVVSPNNDVNASFVGLTSGANRAIFTRSTTLGVNWSAEVDLGVAEDIAMSVTPSNEVHMLIRNSTNLFQVASSDGFVTFSPSKTLTQNVQTGYINAISTFKEKSFKTKFILPPTIFRKFRSSDSAQMVSYIGAIDVGKPPTVMLSSPLDNAELIEGSTYTFAGEVKSENAGAVVVVNVDFGSGNVPIGTFISDGVTPFNFSKTFVYKNKQLFDGNTAVSPILPDGVMVRSYTFATDTTNNLTSNKITRAYKVKYNRAPKISGTDQDLGAFTQIPIVNYSATDPEAHTFTFTEYLNGKQIRSFAGVAGQVYTVEISHDAWIRLDLDVQHQIKIVATDSAGISSERIYTFTRKETHIEFMLEYGNPDIKADFKLDGMPLRVLVTLERYLPEGASIESVKVCNNYLDDVPTWEDCTGAVKGNRGYLFTNKNKTAPEWAINLWVTIDKGTAKERVLLNGYGGAFD
ncbi:DNRLRE domain-containing protein [Brevibacillus formosus]|uniref:DNRLRE domain-containing protein n=1 Tax=Brevibacillus formosus TaxID=54913 RepID=UPI0018CF30BC|nr:DNRLRE domain-containing protein [Brevibacillus formosus]